MSVIVIVEKLFGSISIAMGLKPIAMMMIFFNINKVRVALRCSVAQRLLHPLHPATV